MSVVWKDEYFKLTRKRSLVMLIVLSILTLGIYIIYFDYKYIKDINMICEGDKQKSPSIVKYIIFNLITFGIYNFFWIYKQQNRMKYYGEANNLDTKESGATLAIMTILSSILTVVVRIILSESFISAQLFLISTLLLLILLGATCYVWHILIKNLNILVENVFESKPADSNA